MSALFQSIATELGRAGGGYAEARDTATAERNKAKVDSYNMALELRQQLQSEQVQRALQSIRERQLKQHEAESILDFGTTYDPATKQWYRMLHNLSTDKTMRYPVGTPESVIRTQEQQKEQDTRLAQRDQDMMDRMEAMQDREDARARLRAKAAAGGGPGDIDDFAEAVRNRDILFNAIPSKWKGSVLTRMKQKGWKMPAQITEAQEITLDTRQSALDQLIYNIQEVQKNEDLFKSIPNASLVELAGHSGTVAGLATRWLGLTKSQAEKDRIDYTAAQLRSMQESINTIRPMLSAMGFRGKEGADMMLSQTAFDRALASPGVTHVVLANTLKLARKLRGDTERFLNTGEDVGGAAAAPGVIVVKPEDLK